MQRRGLLVLAAAVVAGSAVSACTSSAEPEVEPTVMESATGEGKPLTGPEANRVLSIAVRNVQVAQSLGFEAEAEVSRSGLTTTRVTTGGWVSEPLSWQATTTIDSPTPSGDSLVPGGDQTTTLLYVEPQIFLKSTMGDATALDDWTDVTASADVPSKGPNPYQAPNPVQYLLLMDADSGEEFDDYTLITGTMPNGNAIDGLGLGPLLSDLGLVDAVTTGRTAVRLKVDLSGLPMSFEYTGDDIDLSAAELPPYIGDLIATGRFATTYFDIGEVDPFSAPPADEVVAP